VWREYIIITVLYTKVFELWVVELSIANKKAKYEWIRHFICSSKLVLLSHTEALFIGYFFTTRRP